MIRLIVAVAIISTLLVPHGYCQDTEDSQIFISGFNAYQQKNYPATIEKMNEILSRYPDTPLRDMVLFWLSRAYFKNGNQRDAAKFMSQFSKEYPDNPLRGTVDEELLVLTARFDKGETLPVGTLPTARDDRQIAARKEQERLTLAKAEEDRRAKEKSASAGLKIGQDRTAAVTAETSRLTAAKMEQERLVAARAEEERKVREKQDARKAEQDRAASVRADEQRVADAEKARLAARKTERDRTEFVAAEAERKAAAQREQDRLIAARAEEERKAQEKIAAAKRAAEEAEKQRIAAEKAEQARLAAVKAEEERAAAVERARLAAEKAEQEKVVQKAEQERIAREQRENEQAARQQAELIRQTLAKAEQKAARAREAREAAELAAAEKQKAEAKSRMAEAVEQAKVAAAKAKEEQETQEKLLAARRAAEEAEQKKLAELKAEQDRAAAEQAAKLKADREKAETERQAAIKKEQERLAAIRGEEELKAREKIAAAKLAAEEAERQKQTQAAAKVEQERAEAVAAPAGKERMTVAAAEPSRQTQAAADKRDQEKLAAEIAAAASEKDRQATPRKEQEPVASPVRVEEKKLAQQQPPPEESEKSRVVKAELREKAIAQYKSIIEKYPNSKPAVAAAAKLKELGVAVAVPQQVAAAEPVPENARILNFEVAQFAGVELNLLTPPQAYPVARRFSLPFELVNRGNGDDSFYIESGFPNEFAVAFADAGSPDTPINQTPAIPPGGSFKGVISMLMPASSIDGRRINYPVKVASRYLPEATQSREVQLTASAPLIRAVIKSDNSKPLPGERIIYRVAILNVGSAGAQDVSFRLNFPPQMEPVDYAKAGFRQEMKAALVIDGIQIKSGESREFTLAFQVKDDSMAGQELLTRAEFINNQLKTNATFVSDSSYVQQQRGILVRPLAERLIVIPGQTVNVPFVVTNSGNGREKLNVATSIKGAHDTVIFHDLNRDGVRQSNEPAITDIGPLAPREEVNIVMEIRTPKTAADGSEGVAQISLSPEGDTALKFAESTRLVYSRPVLDMAMSGGGGRLKPGEVASFDLTITNRGTNLARVVELQSAWPDRLELIAADPVSTMANGTMLWKFKELGAGEKRTIKVSFRIKQGTSIGTNIQVKNVLTYEDQLGGRY